MVAPKTLNVSSLCQKSYSSVEWEQLNPVLLTGEFGYDTDKDDFKIGDGVTSWSDLPYFKDDVNIKAVLPVNEYINATVINYGRVDPFSITVDVDGDNAPFLMIPLYNGAGLEVSGFLMTAILMD